MKTAILILFGLYVVFSVVAFSVGAAGANTCSDVLYCGACLSKPVRIQKLFPAYKAGCYLFSNQDHYYGE